MAIMEQLLQFNKLNQLELAVLFAIKIAMHSLLLQAILQGVLQRCLDQHDGFYHGYLLIAEIFLHMKAPKMAKSYL